MTTQDLFRHLIESKMYSPLNEYSHYYDTEGYSNMCDALNGAVEFDIVEACKEIKEYMASKGVDGRRRQMIEVLLNDKEKEEWSSVPEMANKLYVKYEKDLINLYWNWDKDIASDAYTAADAMLKERLK